MQKKRRSPANMALVFHLSPIMPPRPLGAGIKQNNEVLTGQPAGQRVGFAGGHPPLNEKSRTQTQPHNNNNLSLLVDRESSILKLNDLGITGHFVIFH